MTHCWVCDCTLTGPEYTYRREHGCGTHCAEQEIADRMTREDHR